MRPLNEFASRAAGGRDRCAKPGCGQYGFSTEVLEKNLRRLKAKWHSRCLVNRADSLRFQFESDGTMWGSCIPSLNHQGYDDVVHGGILATLVDASMVQCLMGHGVIAYTAELNIKYQKPVDAGKEIKIHTAVCEILYEKVYKMETGIKQDGRRCVSAKAKFFRCG